MVEASGFACIPKLLEPQAIHYILLDILVYELLDWWGVQPLRNTRSLPSIHEAHMIGKFDSNFAKELNVSLWIKE